MDLSTLITLQFIAHLFTDYFFQSDKQAKEKNKLGIKRKFLVVHFIIALLTSWILSFQVQFVFVALLIAISHIIIDGIKKHIHPNKIIGRYAFYIDQILHISVFTIASIIFDKYSTLYPFYGVTIEWKYTLIAAGYLLCLKPANILIKQIFNSSGIVIQRDADLEKAGRLIGSLERILTLTFVILGEFEAVGFLIAAKSILRFKDGDTKKTEYVLIGTMLSFVIAIGIGIIVLKLIAT